VTVEREALVTAAREAKARAYAPYSGFSVGAALAFDDGVIVTGANVENASYGLSLCAETVAAAAAFNAGKRGGLVTLAIVGDGAEPISPCGRCRQVLAELAQQDGSDPLVLGLGEDGVVREWRLSALLPDAFGPQSLG